MNEFILVVKNLSVGFGKENLLNNVSFTLNRGSIAGLLGASGCGKTTLLRCISGFQNQFQGQIRLKGEDLLHKPIHERGLGFVFQDLSLFPHMNVEQNIGFGLHKLRREEKSQRISELFHIFNLNNLGQRFPHELSGGQQQRVALARSMAPKPDLVLMDEPFSDLDGLLKRQLLTDLRNIIKDQGQTILFVTHSQEELFQFADEGGVLIDGTLHQWSKVEEVYSQPQTPEVASLIGRGSWISIHCGEGGGQTSFGRVNWSGRGPYRGQKIFIRPEQVKLKGESQETGLYVGNIQHYGSHQLVKVFSRESGESLLAQVDPMQELKFNQCVTLGLSEVKIPVLFDDPISKVIE